MGAYNSESITVSSTAIGFTDSAINNGTGNKPLEAVFVVEDAQIRFTTDGSTPTASVGLLAEVGDVVKIEGETDVEAFKAIRTGDTDATIQPHYFNKRDND
ncbi:chitobiase/beta-hexosaminidase C-terminal domain-containing protein [Candidatus Pacearchaeota archaeon]|nr:chitobiase/beta-hexosaminidase C-terminal domain-containing protein [Candidatus Pacearchaeota archaeon]